MPLIRAFAGGSFYHLHNNAASTKPVLTIRAVESSDVGAAEDGVDHLHGQGSHLALRVGHTGAVEGTLLGQVVDGGVGNESCIDSALGAQLLYANLVSISLVIRQGLQTEYAVCSG